MDAFPVEVLDTTLRDGSYVVDFQFTDDDTAIIVSALDSAGIPYIEVAHGLGLGAARAGKGSQASSDEAYLKAAASVIRNAKFGAFFIPGIGTEEDLRLGADCGIHFVRIGTNVTEVRDAEPFVSLAKSLGLLTFCNLMKSYAVSPETFGKQARIAQEMGADVVCVVDSAGGMLPEDVMRYIEAAQRQSSVRLGFHGHNNLSMAISNTLTALDAGATVLDASLQGMGRSEGNAVTEILVALLQKRGLLESVDVNGLLDISEAFIRPLLHNKGYSAIGVTSGRAKFHSSFIGAAMSAASEYGVDPRELILRLGRDSQIDTTTEIAREAARKLAQESPANYVHVALGQSGRQKNADFLADVSERAAELREKSKKLAIPSILNVVVSDYEPTHVSPFVETRFGCALSNVMLESADDVPAVLDAVDDTVDYVLLDGNSRNGTLDLPSRDNVLEYVDSEMWVDAVVNHVVLLLGGRAAGRTVAVLGVPELATPAETAFSLRGAAVVHPSSEDDPALANVDALVAISPRKPCVTAKMIRALSPAAIVFDGGIGSLSGESIAAASERKLTVARVDLRPALAAVALELIAMKGVVEDHMGRAEWDGAAVVAGGIIGREGEIIVDSIRFPTKIIGVADGKGGIMPPDFGAEEVRKVRETIANRQLRQGG